MNFADPVSIRRLVWLFCLLSPAALLGYGYYLQYVEYLDPCPLCITQRLFYIVIGVTGLVGLVALRSLLWQRLCAIVVALGAIGGLVTAGRQVWMQHLPPDKVPECGPGLQYWLDNMPLLETVRLLFRGDGNCAEVHWRFLGLSIAEWSLAWFALFLLLGLWLLVRGIRRAP